MLHAPVLQLNVDRMHEVDPRNVENLFGMWTVFSKCASTIPDGKRLENLSWRVWARETLCCPPQPEKTIVPAIDIPRSSKDDLPSLSNSLGSNTDNESVSTLENSALSKSRGKEVHLTPSALGKMITTIQEMQNIEPLNPEMEACVVAKIAAEKPVEEDEEDDHEDMCSEQTDQPTATGTADSSYISTVTSTTANTEGDSVHRSSDTSVSSDGLIRSGSVVHGFSPLPSLRSRASTSTTKTLPILAKSVAKSPVAKKTAMFTMGASSEDDDSSFDQNMFEPRKSSLSKSLTRDDNLPAKKTASFREVIEQRTFEVGSSPVDDNAIASDDDDDDSPDDDDEDDVWEDDEAVEEEKKSPLQPIFKRVDSSANLPSRRSILTAGLTEGDRSRGLLAAASKSGPAVRGMQRSASHAGPFMPPSPEQNEDDGIMMMRATGNSKAIAINSQSQSASAGHALAHSPRTTRRNMLSTELTESLRKSLLWERQQKNTTVNAFLRREARSMANLQRAGQTAPSQDPVVPPSQPSPMRNNNSSNDYYNVASEYHTTGW